MSDFKWKHFTGEIIPNNGIYESYDLLCISLLIHGNGVLVLV